jgi:hypothetical protein
MKIALILCGLLGLQLIANTQSLTTKYELGLNAGAIVYQGDLTPHLLGDLKTTRPALSIYVSRNISSHFAVRLGITTGKLTGDDSKYEKPTWREERNYFFSSPLTELSGQVTWNVRGLIPNDAGIVNFTPYLFAGGGYSFINTRRDWSRFNNAHFSDQVNVSVGLTEDVHRELPRGIVVIPVGAGVRLGITQHISLSAEVSYRHTFTDYIDGFSQGANPRENEHYYTHTIGFIYSLGKTAGKLECPKAWKP